MSACSERRPLTGEANDSLWLEFGRVLAPLAAVLEPRIDGLAFECEDAEDAFVYSSQWFAADESFECFDAEGELARRQGMLASEATLAQPLEVGGLGVLGSVDDAQVLAPRAS